MSHKLNAAQANKKPGKIRKRICNLTGASDLGALQKFGCNQISPEKLVSAAVAYIVQVVPFASALTAKVPSTTWPSSSSLLNDVLGSCKEPLTLSRELLDGEMNSLCKLPRELLTRPDVVLPYRYRPKEPYLDWLRICIPSLSVFGDDYRPDEELGLNLPLIALRLSELDRDNRHAADLMWRGNLQPAWIAGLSSHDDYGPELLRDFGVVLTLILARLRMGLIRQLGVAPATVDLTTAHIWQTVPALGAKAVFQPAKQLKALIADGPLVTAAMSVVPLETLLSSSHVLMSPAMKRMYADVEERLLQLGMSSEMREKMDQLLRYRVTADIEDLTSEIHQLADHAPGRMSFVEDRLGLPATHAAVVVAASLLECPRQIEDCLARIAIGGSAPPRASYIAGLPACFDRSGTHGLGTFKVSKAALGRVTEWLRRSGESDARAVHRVPNDRRTESAPGKAMVSEACERFVRDGIPSDAAPLILDPSWWFR